MASTNTNKPHILLVQGAWDGPSTWKALIPLLNNQGYNTSTVALPSVSAQDIQADATGDVKAIKSKLTSLADAAHDIIVVMHSYAGIPGSSAIEGLSKSDRRSAGKHGGVVNLIYVSAFMLDAGVSLVEAVSGGKTDVPPPDWWLFQDTEPKSLMPGDPIYRFYHDVTDQKVLDELTEGIVPQAVGAFYSKNTYAAWKDIDTTYVACLADRAIPLEGQRGMLSVAQETLNKDGLGRKIREVELDSSHSPMLSMPDRLADEIVKTIQAGN